MTDFKMKQYIDEHYEEAISLLKTLGKIPAPSRNEDKRAAFCRDWFIAQGVEHVWIDEAKNVICSLGVNTSNDIVVFMAHTDIVFPDTEELPMNQEGNILYAPGIGDDTANLVNLMITAKCFLNKKPNSDDGFLIVANACEEGLGNLDGCKAVMRAYGNRIKAVYSFDGYLSQCTDIPVGSHRYRISVQAEGGHSYLNYGNENAIITLSSLIQDMNQFVLPTKEKTTQNVGYISGGTTINSIAEECFCLYEYRSASQECLTLMQDQLKELVNRYCQDGHKAELEILGIRPGKGEFAPGILDTFTNKTIDHITQFYTGDLDRNPYSTDANIPLSMGIPGNTIGTVVGGKAHTREEWVDLSSLRTGMAIVFSIINAWVNCPS